MSSPVNDLSDDAIADLSSHETEAIAELEQQINAENSEPVLDKPTNNGSSTVVTESVVDNPTNNSTAMAAENMTRKRERRNVGSGLKATESHIYQLSTKLTKLVSSAYRLIKVSQQKLSQEISLDLLYDIHDALGDQAKEILGTYQELLTLHENDEGKLPKSLQTTYTQVLAQMKFFRDSIDKDIDALEEQEEERQAEMMRNLNEEINKNARLFQELTDESNQRRMYGHELPAASPNAEEQNSEQQHSEGSVHNQEAAEDHSEQHQENALQFQPTPQSEPDLRPQRAIQQSSERLHQREIKAPSPSTSTNNRTDPMDKLADVLASAIRKRSIEPDVFKGDLLQFKDWEVDFDMYLRNERIDGVERLRYLKKFTGGEAKKAIEGHFMSNTEHAYAAARQLLKERYGNEHILARSFRDQLSKWPSVSDDGKTLLEFSDFLGHLLSAQSSVHSLRVLDDYSENEKMCRKLPVRLKWKWARIVAKTEESYYRYPTFKEFCSFVKEEAKIGQLPLARGFNSKTKLPDKRLKGPGQSRNTFSTAIDKGCVHCKLDNHQVSECRKLQRLPKAEKSSTIRQLSLCFKCVRPGHLYKECATKLKCSVCGKSHATVHHDPNFKPRKEITQTQPNPPATTNSGTQRVQVLPNETNPKSEPPGNTTKTVLATTTTNGLTTMAIPVKMSVPSGKSMLVYALLDNMSDACYASPQVLKRLEAKVSVIEPNVTIHTMNGQQTSDIERYDNLHLTGFMNDSSATINAYKRNIQCDKSQLPSPEQAKRFRHMSDIAKHMPPLLDIPIGLLIGMNYTEVIQPLETRTSTKGEPFAVKTLFGWTMCGGREPILPVNRKAYMTSAGKEIMDLLEQDFKDAESDDKLSQQDIRFLKIMEQRTEVDRSGNYIMPLPFTAPPTLPNNRAQAEQRFKGLLKKFNADASYQGEYNNFMQDLIDSGHAEEAPSTTESGKVWFLPHFGVRHKRKGKLRVVFDASAKFKGVALNDELLSGPDNLNSLLGILLRFRREPVAITCDIQQMFLNFIVDRPDRDFLRFLWTGKNGKIKDYRMTKHLFGAASSPGVATYGLRRIADDYKEEHQHAAKFLKEEFYVDDGVTSVSTEEQAIDLITNAVKICTKANIRLHKFNSNRKTVLLAIPESERSEQIKNINIFEEQLPNERTLGMEWNLESDSFHFSAPETNNAMITKRNVLSKIAQIYDPMGLISPLILKGKLILQRVTAADLEWDQLLEPGDMREWRDWLDDIGKLANFSIKRCLKPPGNIKTIQLHHFSDASSQGYGACSYLRYTTAEGEIACHLIMSKSRVAPLKKVTTIPRLELQGAVTTCRLANLLRKELKLPIDKEFYWTDSTITLGYINNEAKRFHVYVANRVAEIRNSSDASQWKKVSTKDNPADLTSRGCMAEQVQMETWLTGPAFLKQNDINKYIREHTVNTSLQADDPEIRSITSLVTTKTTTLASKFTKFSRWTTLIKSLALLKKVITEYKNRKAEAKTTRIWRKPSISPDDLLNAENFIIGVVQQEAYPSMVGEESLKNLNPQIDDRNILRVGGRTISNIWNKPIIIPKHSHLSTLITRHYHEKIYHMGFRSTLGAVRGNGYWLINGPANVKSVLNNCVGCKRLRGKLAMQYMGNVPNERLERAAPFTHIGADVFGPFYIKERRSEVKRWGLLITCFYTRAVHIELLEEMTTDCLIQAMRCFMALRGPIQSMTVDNGTNFVGMRNELAKESCVNNSQMKGYLEQNRIEFHFNTPTASHQGGVTERMIRTARDILNGMRMQFKMVDAKTLRTAFYEVTNIINSRPLTGTKITDANDPVVTPNLLLNGKVTPLVAPPPGTFESDDVYGRKRWKHSQVIADEFWRTWKNEYLNMIMKRQKWTQKKENMSVDDIVMIQDDNMARCDWRIGRVSNAVAGKDGLVRTVEVTLGNRLIDRNGRPIQQATVLNRPITKVVVVLKA